MVGAAASACAAALAWAAQGRPRPFGELAAAAERPEVSPDSAYRLTSVALTTTTGRALACVLRTPAAAPAPRSLLGVLLQGGIGTGRRAATLVADDFAGLVLACDYPWRDPSGLSAVGFLARLPGIRREVLATPDALGVAATYLLSRPEMDPHRLAGVGASLGVPGVSAWASRDARVAAVALVMGGADLGAILDANLRTRFGWRVVRAPLAAALALLLRPLEPARTVSGIAPRPLLIVAARGDERVPVQATEALIAAAREPKRVLWLGGRHLLPSDTLLLRQITDSTFAWVSGHLGARP